MLAPEVLNEKGIVKFATKLNEPEKVYSGEAVLFNGVSVTPTIPQAWGNTLFAAGANEVKVKVTQFVLDAANMQPPTNNIAGKSSFTETVTGHEGETIGLSLAPEAILLEVIGYHSGVQVIGPFGVTCTHPAVAFGNTIPIGPPPSPTETAEYKNWVLSGSITDKKQGQAITLPEGSTFNGHGEVNTETGAGSVSGNLSIPPFKTTIELFGVLPVELGMTVSQSGPLQGTVAKSETVPGDEALTIPLKLGVGITSLGIMGMTVPTSCATTESASLALADNLTREELLSKGWSFTGTTTLPRFKCEGGFLAGLLSWVLSTLISGPENPYSLRFAP